MSEYAPVLLCVPKCMLAGSGGSPFGPSTLLKTCLFFSKYVLKPFSPSSFTSTNCVLPASPIFSVSFGAAADPTVKSPTTSDCVTVDSLGYDLRTSRFQYGFSAMSPAGVVTGSMYSVGSFAAGGGLRKCGFRGTPDDRPGSRAKNLCIRPQMP